MIRLEVSFRARGLWDFIYFLHKCDIWSSALVRRLGFWTSARLPSASTSNPPLLLAPFGLPHASPPPQSPIRHSCSLLLDFLVPPLHLNVQSAALSRSFWTSSHLPTTSKSNPQLLLAPFGLPHASPPLQSPIRSSCSLLLDFLVPPLRLKVQSAALSHSFWTSSCLPSASKSNPPLLLAPFGLSHASPLPQSPIRSSFSLLLDFLVPPLRFKVQSATLSRPFWTSSCLPSFSKSNPTLFTRSFWTSPHLPTTSKSNPPLLLAPFGLPRASPPPQSPIRHSCSPLLDFLAPPLHLKVQSAALSRPFWTSSCLPATSKSNPPLFLAPFGLPRISPPLQSPIHHSFSPHHAKKADCKAIRQSHSGNSNQPA